MNPNKTICLQKTKTKQKTKINKQQQKKNVI